MGTYRDASTGYRPRPGDLCFYPRAGQDPRTGGQGHVAACTIAPTAGGAYQTIGGNEAPGWGRVRLTPRQIGDAVGFGVRS
jgi:hypothetical protein